MSEPFACNLAGVEALKVARKSCLVPAALWGPNVAQTTLGRQLARPMSPVGG